MLKNGQFGMLARSLDLRSKGTRREIVTRERSEKAGPARVRTAGLRTRSTFYPMSEVSVACKPLHYLGQCSSHETNKSFFLVSLNCVQFEVADEITLWYKDTLLNENMKGDIMSTKTVFFKLEFPEIDPNFPSNPEVEIHVRHDGTFRQLTPKITEALFDTYIDDLIKELDELRSEGKRKFANAKTRLKA